MGSASSHEIELEGLGQVLDTDATATDHFEAAGVGNQDHIDLSQVGVLRGCYKGFDPNLN